LRLLGALLSRATCKDREWKEGRKEGRREKEREREKREENSWMAARRGKWRKEEGFGRGKYDWRLGLLCDKEFYGLQRFFGREGGGRGKFDWDRGFCR
jgi:hypothetical protein